MALNPCTKAIFRITAQTKTKVGIIELQGIAQYLLTSSVRANLLGLPTPDQLSLTLMIKKQVISTTQSTQDIHVKELYWRTKIRESIEGT